MKKIPIKPYTVNEICGLYNISRHVFFSWIKLIRKDIGVIRGKIFTPKQVRVIFDHVGPPDSED